MATDVRELKLFVASPNDVAAERQIAELVINEVDNNFRNLFETILKVIKWEKQPPLTQPMTRISIQEEINEKVKTCDIFILLLYKRIGSREEGYDVPNTKREIDIILKRIERNEKVMLLTYFRQLKENEDPGEQEIEVKELRTLLEKDRIWHSTYKDIYDFERQFTHHLYQTVLRFSWETTKKKATKHFWQLGEAERRPSTNLAIIYPPIDRSYTEKEDPDCYWHKRLFPNVVYEDYRALQKIQKSLGIIGHRDYRIFTTSNIPKDVKYMNRVWLCLPRNQNAMFQLKNYIDEGRSQFLIIPRTKNRYAQIKWKNKSNNNNFFTINSPLYTYLELQRGGEMKGGEWKASLERIVAKDFAIFSRFIDKSKYIDKRSGNLYDYIFCWNSWAWHMGGSMVS